MHLEYEAQNLEYSTCDVNIKHDIYRWNKIYKKFTIKLIYEETSNKIILLRISLDRMRKIISNCCRILKTLHNTSLSIGNNFL